jgi:hypothetical protein
VVVRPIGPPPVGIVVLETIGRLAVVTPDGAEVRELATKVAVTRFAPRLAVSPDSGTIYFDNGRRSVRNECPVNGQGVDVIEAVSRTGGPVAEVTRGRSPTLSPDGRRLAFLRPSDCFGNNDHLVVRDLASGTERSWDVAQADGEFRLPSWSPDGNHVAYQYAIGGDITARVLDVTAPGDDDTNSVRLVTQFQWYGYVGAERYVGTFRDGPQTHVVIFGPGLNDPSLEVAAGHNDPTSVSSDPSGTRLLIAFGDQLLHWDCDVCAAGITGRRISAAAWIDRSAGAL